MSQESRWKKLVKEKWKGRCPHCGKTPNGGVHHIIPRGCKRTKFILENGILTCYTLHRLFEKNKDIKAELLEASSG